MYTYAVDLYGTWEREGSGAQAFIDFEAKQQPWEPKKSFKVMDDTEVTHQERDPHSVNFFGPVVLSERGTVHVKLDVEAANAENALKKAKGKINRWLKANTCSPPKITWT